MTGMTMEITSVTEALDYLYKFCVQTHGKPPANFMLGKDEGNQFAKEEKINLESGYWTNSDYSAEIRYKGIGIKVDLRYGIGYLI